MDATLKLWAVIFAVGLLNYLSRLSFIAVFARLRMPPWLERALRYVPAAMLTALILPMITAQPAVAGTLAFHPKIVAALLAGVVAFFTRSTLWTLGAGMSALWLLQAVY
ncbi:MAG TPA: AzlD domain-containing protein [Casimicrobiaceae bacterium]|nr:AzlD domain-containing protein [Casimicrobiaceae bacterium]